ncbi:DUF167 family protein [Bosea vaviloviae]|uniref:UPF0235 protein BHK69_03685 n=1 Tax=Bosea vaviloviae TaxID=1526658 RepID=A0A1D7TX71_9HYPH|nr:DUF167 family protein [Bosea vaviloviae]AOO79702.1 hypothetical protein BHK69_03685 [Bosea vaviloviae]
MPAWRESPDGLLLSVRLTPRGGRDGLDGVETLADGREVLKVRVRASPSDGEANAALVALLAKLLGLPRSRVTLVAGASARSKTVLLEGDSATLLARLAAFLAAG